MRLDLWIFVLCIYSNNWCVGVCAYIYKVATIHYVGNVVFQGCLWVEFLLCLFYAYASLKSIFIFLVYKPYMRLLVFQ